MDIVINGARTNYTCLNALDYLRPYRGGDMSFISRVSGVVTEAKFKVIAITLISRQVSVLPEPLLQ